jgi:hypothetical protein
LRIRGTRRALTYALTNLVIIFGLFTAAMIIRGII